MDTEARKRALTTATEDGVAVVTFDLPGESINKFSRAVKDEFAETFATLEQDVAVRAIVIISGKPDIFVAGADIEEFVALKGTAEATQLSREGQAFLDRVAACPKPVVAAIHGACLGGGLELVLACHYRLASDEALDVLSALRKLAERNLADVERVVRGYFHDSDSMEPVSREELARRLREGSVTVLDVRPADEFALGHIAGAISTQHVVIRNQAIRHAQAPGEGVFDFGRRKLAGEVRQLRFGVSFVAAGAGVADLVVAFVGGGGFLLK